MSMELRIKHTTGYEYDGQVVTSYNEARMTPLTTPEQLVVHTRLDIAPTPWTYTYRDYHGALVTAFELLEPHPSLEITATATVHTNRAPIPDPVLSWEELRAPAVADRHTEYLVVDDVVAPPEDLAVRFKEIGASSATPGEAARAVCDLVNREVEYRSGATDVVTAAAEAWEQRGGVCQDMAHLVLGGLRTLGIPGRYVSGYLHPLVSAEIGETVQGESHAWVEWWDDGWRGFDPTNDQEIGDRHVVIAAGREYADVRPLSGIYSGGATSSMFVNVEVTRLA